MKILYHNLDGNGRICLIVSFHGLHVRRHSKYPVMNCKKKIKMETFPAGRVDLFRASMWKNLTFTVGCVEGFVSLDVDVSRLEGHQGRFLQLDVGEESL